MFKGVTKSTDQHPMARTCILEQCFISIQKKLIDTVSPTSALVLYLVKKIILVVTSNCKECKKSYNTNLGIFYHSKV